jgi:anti-sigma factor RsiW
MKRTSTRDRALAAAERWVTRMHGKPTVIHGTSYRTPAQITASLAFAAGWIAGWAARAKGR